MFDVARALEGTPPPPHDLLNKLRGEFPPHYSLNNPIDLTGDASAEDYERTLELILAARAYDVAVVIALYQVPLMNKKVADVIASISPESEIPIVVCSVGGECTKRIVRRLEGRSVPVYPSPEWAVRAAWALARYGKFREGVRRSGKTRNNEGSHRKGIL